MATPTWLAYGFAVLMVAVSVYCIGRCALANAMGRRNHYDVSVSHLLMGLAMIGMLVPRWSPVPVALWEVVFGIMAIYFLGLAASFIVRRGIRGTEGDERHHVSHYLIHMVMACAMLYMYWLGMPISPPSGTGMAMSGPPVGAGDPGLTLFIIVVLLASAIWQTDAASQVTASRQLALSAVGGGAVGSGEVRLGQDGDDRPWLAPRLETCCHVAMCLTMGYMLILMV